MLTRDTRHCEQEIRKRTAKCNLASGAPKFQLNPHTDLSQSDRFLCFQCIDEQEYKLETKSKS